MRVRVKICGITTVEDAIAAAVAGADAIGLIFAKSPRRVTVQAARNIVAGLPPWVCSVGVFVDAPIEEVKATVAATGIHAVQLHGGESSDYVASLAPMSVIKAIRVAAPEDIAPAGFYPTAAILLDTASSQAAGGTGTVFPWEYAKPLAAHRPVILAGGLTVENVARAIKTVKPWGVDVSSGVEASPGRKDLVKMVEFIKRAIDGDARL